LTNRSRFSMLADVRVIRPVDQPVSGSTPSGGSAVGIAAAAELVDAGHRALRDAVEEAARVAGERDRVATLP
jgi:hypothetical protein